MPIIPPILPLPDDDASFENDEVLWQMIVSLRRSLFGEGGPFVGSANGIYCFDGTIPETQSDFDDDETDEIPVSPEIKLDDFTRNDDTTNYLPIETKPPVNKWKRVDSFAISGHNQFLIRPTSAGACGGNRTLEVQHNTSGNLDTRGFAYWRRTWADDQESRALFCSTDGGSDGVRDCVAVRIDTGATPTSQTCYAAGLGYSGGTLRGYIVKMLAGVRTVIAGPTTDIGTDYFVNGDWVKLRVEGSTIKLIRERTVVDTEALTVTDTDITCGACGWAQGLQWSLGIALGLQFDTWEGEDLSETTSRDCFEGTNVNCDTQLFPGQILMVGKFGQIATACSNLLVADPDNDFFGINTCEPSAPLDVWDGRIPNKQLFVADTEQIFVLTHLLFSPDNTYDLGTSTLSRPRDLFMAGKLNLAEITTPGTPAANTLHLYVKDKSGVSALYFKNDAGTESEIVASGVSGTGAANRVALWSGASTLTSNSNLTYDGTSFKVGTVGPHAIGGATDVNYQVLITGSFAGTGGMGGLRITSTFSPVANANLVCFSVVPTIVEAGSGTHALIAGVQVNLQTVTAGAGNVTHIAGVNISAYTAASGTTTASGLKVDAPSGGSSNYAILVDSGVARFDGDGTNVFEIDADTTAPGAATGRIPFKDTSTGATRYIMVSDT